MILNDLGVGSGPPLAIPYSLALDASDKLLVADIGDPTLPAPSLFGVDATSGNRSLVAGGNTGSGTAFGTS